jgi:hypothetical protein
VATGFRQSGPSTAGRRQGAGRQAQSPARSARPEDTGHSEPGGDGEKGHAYSALEDEADGRAFIARGRDDRHQFRFIVGPEDAARMGDLRSLTRNLMRQIEQDLDTRLIGIGHVKMQPDGTFLLPRNLVAILERQEVERGSGRRWQRSAASPSGRRKPASM